MSRGDDEETDLARVSESDARAIDEGVRALRDAPVSPERRARMRAALDAALDARIEAAAGSDGHSATPDSGDPAPLSRHPRWRRLVVPAAAALAAAILAALLLPSSEPERAQQPESASGSMDRVAHATPAEERGSFEGARESAVEEAEMLAREPAVEGAETLALDPAVEGAGGLALEPAPRDEVDVALEASSDEELAVALEYERLADYDVIAQLELLELLEELEAEGRI